MIQITCTNCRKQLAIDDAFAGGVCRCHACGTIQTVPARLKQGAAAGILSQGAARTSKTLYKQRARGVEPGSGTGLDELAEIVASSGSGSGSGLGSSGLTHPRRTNRPATLAAPAAPIRADERKVVRLIAGIGGAIVVLLLVILAVIYQRLPGGAAAGTGQTRKAPAPTPAAAPAAEAKPTFCEVPLDGNSVIYVLDRGDGSREAFGHVRDAVLSSAAALGPERKFQIVFWDNGSEDKSAFPEAGMTFANKDNVTAVGRDTADIYAFGQSDARSALERALKQKPAVVVLVTGKGWLLDEEFIAMVEDVRKTTGAAGTTIHTFAIGDASTALNTIADRTGGQYRHYGKSEIGKFTR